MNLTEIRRSFALLLFSAVSLIPFNFLQYITLPFGPFKLPFYYLMGVPVLILAVLALIEIKPVWKTSLVSPFLIICLSMSVSLFDSVNVPWTMRSIASFLLRGPLIAVAMLTLYNENKDVKTSVNFLATIGMIIAYLGILEFINNKNPLYHDLYVKYNPYYFLVDVNVRGGMSGTVGHPLPLAALLALLLPISFTQSSRTIFRSCAFLIIAVCIYLSFSRSSWISAFICVIMLFCKGQNKEFISLNFRKIFTSVVVAMLTFILIHIFLPKVSPIFQKRVSGRMWWFEVFHSHRAASYTTTFNVLKKYPLWGVGFGNYPEIHEEFVAKYKGADPAIKTPDNQYLRWLADAGIVGFVCLVAFFVLFFRKFAKAYRKCPDEELKTLMWAMFCGIVGFMVNLMTFDGFFWMAPNFAFWMMIGLLAAAIDLAEKKTDAYQAEKVKY